MIKLIIIKVKLFFNFSAPIVLKTVNVIHSVELLYEATSMTKLHMSLLARVSSLDIVVSEFPLTQTYPLVLAVVLKLVPFWYT